MAGDLADRGALGDRLEPQGHEQPPSGGGETGVSEWFRDEIEHRDSSLAEGEHGGEFVDGQTWTVACDPLEEFGPDVTEGQEVSDRRDHANNM